MATLENIRAFLLSLQDEICHSLTQADGKASFREDPWTRAEGGGGRSRVMTDGAVFEKAGVNFSHVHGTMPEKIATRLNLPPGSFFHATGVSLVLHPHSPHVPITHMNIRYFEIPGNTWWFGGGIDLTPVYVDRDDARFFHRALKSTCDRHDPEYYTRFKKWCDEYFFLKHRNEMRGIGGIFFDHLRGETEEEKSKLFSFWKDVGNTFAPTYCDIVSRHTGKPYTGAEKKFQLLRRSRYVEFNLLYDAGTKFGLDTGGRIESILMSMPPVAGWEYDYHALPDSKEEETLKLLQPKDWV